MWQDAKDRAKEQHGKMSFLKKKEKKNRGGEGAEEAIVQWLREKIKGQKYS